MFLLVSIFSGVTVLYSIHGYTLCLHISFPWWPYSALLLGIPILGWQFSLYQKHHAKNKHRNMSTESSSWLSKIRFLPICFGRHAGCKLTGSDKPSSFKKTTSTGHVVIQLADRELGYIIRVSIFYTGRYNPAHAFSWDIPKYIIQSTNLYKLFALK